MSATTQSRKAVTDASGPTSEALAAETPRLVAYCVVIDAYESDPLQVFSVHSAIVDCTFETVHRLIAEDL